MNKVIEEGTLRLSRTESTCDVILSCNGHRLMAHKLILSIASPVLKELLEKCPSSDRTAVVILPDIGATTISTMLDYIYTGTALVRSGGALQEFLSVAKFLRIAVDPQNVRDLLAIETFSIAKNEPSRSIDENKPAAPTKRIPELLPIGSEMTMMRKKQCNPQKNRVCNIIVPSPWCQTRNVDRVLGDPRAPSPLRNCDKKIPFNTLEDSNNNFEQIDNKETARQSSKRLDTVIRHLYLTNPELRKNNSENAAEGRNIAVVVPEPYCRVKRTLEDPIGDPSPQFNAFPFSKQLQNLVSPRTTDEKACPSITRDGPEEGTEPSANPSSEVSDKTRDQPTISDDSNSTIGSDSNHCESTIENVKKKPFKCNDCDKTFSQLRNYKYHRSVHEGTKAFSAKCPECGKTFNDRGYLSSHMKIHRDRKEYACPHCPKRFNQRVAYNMHLRIHTGVKPHECPTCGKSFSRKMLLKQHQRVHTGERPYSCPECGKSFADRSNMSLHARLHTGVKPYACSICPKSFTKKHHLKTHMNFHTGLKPYSCQNCGLAFSQSSNMRTHYKKCILKEVGNATRTEDSNSTTDNT